MNYTAYVKQSMLKWLQDLFAQEAFYEDPNHTINDLTDVYTENEADLYAPTVDESKIDGLINDFQWTTDPQTTKIFIADQYTTNMESPQARPALIVTRGQIGWENRGGIDQHDASSFGSGARRHTDLVVGQVVVNCFSREGLEAELLANIVFQSIRFFAREIRKQTNIFEIDSASIGGETLIETDSDVEWTVVPVSSVIHFQDRWTIKAPSVNQPESIEVTTNPETKYSQRLSEVVRLDD